MRWIVAFVRFWYDFIVGDDWRLAVGVIATIGLTALIADHGAVAWVLMPLLVVSLLLVSLRRGVRATEASSTDEQR